MQRKRKNKQTSFHRPCGLLCLEPAALIILNIPKYLSTFRQLFTLNILSDFSGIRQDHYIEVGLQCLGVGGGGARNLGCRFGNPKP